MQNPLGSPSSPAPSHDDPYHQARQGVVERINQDRTAAGLQPVELDELASQVGDAHCQEMAANHYLSHWNLRGLLPYHRYYFAGGRDYVQENLSRTTVFSSKPNPISTAPQDILADLLNAQQHFMDERPPLDGHRKNVLDPGHTHVGIGLAVVGGEFTMAEEFINRYVRLSPLPETLPKGSLPVEGQILQPARQKDYGPYYCSLLYEGWPQPRNVAELNRTYAYQDMSGKVVGRVPPWEMSFDSSKGSFRFNLAIDAAGPGYYHMVFWVRRPIRSIPYQLGAPGAYQIDTADGVACASCVLRAE